MARRHITWLEKELPIWIREGLISEDGATALRARYAAEAAGGRNWALAIFSILGGLLIGTGIITILANNWQELGRGARTVVALLPLLAAQTLAVFVYRRDLLSSVAWREGVATFWILSVGAALSLIWQTYHLPSEWTLFFLLWALLSLPVVYLMDSLAAVALYLLIASVWSLSTVDVFDGSGSEHFYWVLLAAVVPMALIRRRAAADSAGSAFVFWLLAVSLCVGTGASLAALSHGSDDLIALIIALVATSAVAVSRLAFHQFTQPWKDPFGLLGGLTIFILALVLSFGSPWGSNLDGEMGIWLFTVAAAVIWLGLSWLVLQGGRMGPVGILLLAFPVVLLADLGFSMASHGGDIALLLYNIYLLALGVLLIWDGARCASLSLANAGLLVVAVHLLVRLFDSDIPFTLKGILFILVGAGFLGANFAIVKKRRQTRSDAPESPISTSS